MARAAYLAAVVAVSVALRPPGLASACARSTAASGADPSETFPGPASPAAQPQWFASQTAWRAQTLAGINYNGSVYADYLPWTSSLFIAPQVHIYDRYLYDPTIPGFTVDRFLADVTTRYGGVDGVLLWHSYPNMGVDDRNQFQLLEDIPGGLPALAALADEFHARGVKVLWPYNPWDQGLAPNNATDDVVMAQAQVAIHGDGFNGDTMDFIPESFWTSALALNHPLALQTEGTPSLAGLGYTKMAWGYWDYPVIPGVDSYKWLETRHITQVSDRWAQDHTNDIQGAFFNGDGFVSWENVWSIWNAISLRDGAAIKATAHLMRYFAPFFSSPDWEPHTVLHADASAASVFASRWPLAAAPASGYASNATLWTIVGRSTAANFTGPVVVVPCAAPGVQYFDVYRGAAVSPAAATGGGCALTLSIEAGGYGAVLAVAPGDVTPALQTFLTAQAKLTVRALASYSTANPILQQNMTAVEPTKQFTAAPPGTVLVTGTPPNQSFAFVVNGTMYEPFFDWNGPQNEGVDVQFPWEPVAVRYHSPHSMAIAPFFMDEVPVSNDAFQTFLTATAYAPTDSHNFLRAWNCSGGVGSGVDCSVPPAWGNRPVTWVDLLDARAYCAWAGKRLPNDWEWQFAASPDGRLFPWGNSYDASCVPPVDNGRTTPVPADSGSYPCGASPFGVQDMMGNVWQWTNEFMDDHTRSGLVRGGSRFVPQTTEPLPYPKGNNWYFPANVAIGQVNALTHNKLVLMGPSYDRHGTVGFRCVADADPSLHWIPLRG